MIYQSGYPFYHVRTTLSTKVRGGAREDKAEIKSFHWEKETYATRDVRIGVWPGLAFQHGLFNTFLLSTEDTHCRIILSGAQASTRRARGAGLVSIGGYPGHFHEYHTWVGQL